MLSVCVDHGRETIMTPSFDRRGLLLGTLALAACSPRKQAGGAPAKLLNVSYDPTRELYHDYNAAFDIWWKSQGHPGVTVEQSHGGSGKQARSVVDGLQADVVTLGLAADIDAIAERGLIAPNWAAELPQNSCPYTSTIVFLVRQGNPKAIRDWADLLKPGVQVITPNPKTSGGARWNFLAAWAYGQRAGGSEEAAQKYVADLLARVPVLDTGARGATTTFVQRGIGDVLLAWENEAFLAIEELGAGKVEIVTPGLSILAEPPVAVVDTVVDKHGSRGLAEAYLQRLYSPEGQEIIAKHHFRPRDAAVTAKYAARFPKIELVTIADFGGWKPTQAKFFADGGVFDKIYQPHS
jgi:sulfate/thiosulfate transport system substrate-binding protein